ncbi:hypothetical protein M2387_000668 [Klebsiella sp. BIGb0407]|nr:hypothetical protein [Klebsiella sp. BIGb0407]
MNARAVLIQEVRQPRVTEIIAFISDTFLIQVNFRTSKLVQRLIVNSDFSKLLNPGMISLIGLISLFSHLEIF